MESKYELPSFGELTITDADSFASKVLAEIDLDRNGFISKTELRSTQHSAKTDLELRFDPLRNLSNDEWGFETGISANDLKTFASLELKKKNIVDGCFNAFSGEVKSEQGKAIYGELLVALVNHDLKSFERSWQKAHGDKNLILEIGQAMSKALESRERRFGVCYGRVSLDQSGNGLLSMNSGFYRTDVSTSGSTSATYEGWLGDQTGEPAKAFAELHGAFVDK